MFSIMSNLEKFMGISVEVKLQEPYLSDEETREIEQRYTNELLNQFGSPEAVYRAYIEALMVFNELGEYPCPTATDENNAIMAYWHDKNSVAVAVAFGRATPRVNQFDFSFKESFDD